MSPFEVISWKVFNDIAHWIAIIALGVWGYLRTKDNDNAKAVQKVAQELADFIKASGECNAEQNLQLNTLREKLSHMPTEQDLTHLSNDISAMKSQINGVAGLLTRVERQTNLIHEHLLKQR